MNYLHKHYPEYDCDENGIIYKNGNPITPFKSNKYLQVCLFDVDHKKHILGVHTVVAMRYLNYFEGCVVHHLDEDTTNNKVTNLVIMTRREHESYHAKQNLSFKLSNKGKQAWNKGLKMSDEFCKHCSDSAKKRSTREKLDN